MIKWLLVVILLTSCTACTSHNVQQQKQEVQDDNSKVITTEDLPIPPPTPTIEEQIKEYVRNMTIEEKIGQILMPAFRESQYGQQVDTYIEPIQKTIEQYKVGGVILFKENIKTKEQVQLLIEQMYKGSGIPLFVAVDEEGGSVSRIASNPNMGYTPLPSAFEIGETGDLQLAYKTGKQLGNMLNELGFNMNFAPVADIWSNPQNSVIGKRSFGKDAKLVSSMVVQTVRGLQDANVISVIKHFPGHGDTREDTHTQRAFVNRSLQQLEERELIPFQDAINDGVDGVMVAHVEVPQVDEGSPASLSYRLITDILKNQMHFQGLVITDALDMSAIIEQYGKGEAPLQSFLAGADILLMPDVEEAYKALLEACKNNTISEERLNESVYKVIYAKYKYGMIAENFFK